MLNQLIIRNYATAESLDIALRPGMSVLTGETGAGKSVILGALGLTLGDRADKTVIRAGASKTDISAEFETIDNQQARQWLQDNDLESEDQTELCILRRIVNSDGRSKAYINGSPVTLANLKTLGEMLVDIHSQHEHQSLLHKATHQRLLDDFSLQKELVESVYKTWQAWHKNYQKIDALGNVTEEKSAQAQLLAYQLSELDELALGEGELTTLEAEFKQLSNADDTVATLQDVLAICSDNEEQSISKSLNHVITSLNELPHREPTIDAIIGLLDTASIQVEEAVTELRAQVDQLEPRPERLEQINQRLATIHSIARKHKVKPDQLLELIQQLRRQLGGFQLSDEELEKLQQDDTKLRASYSKLATRLSKHRQQAAKKLVNSVNKQLAVLGMPDARLDIQLHGLDASVPAAKGLESIEFLISTNPGQPAKPLAKIASGGELSRISLAIQVITAKTSSTPALVFDEVDVGIGGGVAKSVGSLLRQLGETAQVICVTHQAQVAGQGHHHYFVTKKSTKQYTATYINKLDDEAKIKEVARMLGGEEYSDESLAHAEKMVVNN